jgi:hypothetical protein
MANVYRNEKVRNTAVLVSICGIDVNSDPALPGLRTLLPVLG